MIGNVVDDDGLESDVRVDEDESAEESIRCGVERAGSEGCNGQRD